VWWQELREVENECISHNCSLFPIFLPNIMKIGKNLTKFWQKKFAQFSLRYKLPARPIWTKFWAKKFSDRHKLYIGKGDDYVQSKDVFIFFSWYNSRSGSKLFECSLYYHIVPYAYVQFLVTICYYSYSAVLLLICFGEIR